MKCITCGRSGAKARLIDGTRVCQDCWFQAGYKRVDPGFGSGFDVCSLNCSQFYERLILESNKRQQAEALIEERYSVGSFGFVGFNDTKGLLILKKHCSEDENTYFYDIYSYDQLEDFDVVDRSNVSIVNSDGVGRAVVGGLLFGAAGAVVGAATATQSLTFNNYQDIALVVRTDAGFKSYRFPVVQRVLDKFRELFASKQPQQAVSKQNRALGEADAIMKFKELLDAGLITEEEFAAKKAQILGL